MAQISDDTKLKLLPYQFEHTNNIIRSVTAHNRVLGHVLQWD